MLEVFHDAQLPPPSDPLVSVLISAGMPYLLEWLKWEHWWPLMRPYAPRLNRLVALSIAGLTAVGVTLEYDAAAGTLLIAGLHAERLLATGLQALVNGLVQERVYRWRIDPKR